VIKKICAFMLLVFYTMPMTIAYAGTITENTWLLDTERGYSIRQGGINSIDGVVVETESETYNLENGIRNEGYICVTGEHIDISEDEFNLFCLDGKSPFMYKEYANKENEFFWNFCRVYVDKNCYNEVMGYLKEGERVPIGVTHDLAVSTVIIDYAWWYQKNRIGTVVQEFNNNLPSWVKTTGYLEITSPIDVIIRTEHIYTHTFNDLYVRANEPLLVKLRTGMFDVHQINSSVLEGKEETLPYNNVIQIQDINTEDSPYKLDISETVIKYGIEPIDLDGKPTHSYNPDVDTVIDEDMIGVIVEEKTIVEEEIPEIEEKDNFFKNLFFAILIFLLICFAYASYTYITKNKE